MKYDILDLEGVEIVNKGEKNFYNLDNTESYLVFLKKQANEIFEYEMVNMYGWNSIKDNGVTKVGSDFIGYFVSEVNSVEGNGTHTFIQSGISHRNRGVQINRYNILNIVPFFSAKKMIKSFWVNQKDEYLKPNEEHDNFEQFKYDSLVYSLFNNSSQQSSLRQVTYKGKLWDIKNEFFWMSAERMKELADNNGYDNLYNDARTSPNRHVYNLLFGEDRIYDKLSPDAKAVLDKATELVEKSIKMRMIMSNDENHLDSWDAGYAQLKLVWKEYFSEDFKEFRQLYKNMEDRMRPLVYELGFLMK